MPLPGDIVYRIDRQDRACFFNEAYDEFALANDGEAALSRDVLGRPIWEFLSDATTRLLYREIVDRARGGRLLSFPFRCDSPDRRRWMEMEVAGVGDGEVEFRSHTVSTQLRVPPMRLLRSREPRKQPALNVCGWCKKVSTTRGWVELERALGWLGLFGSEALPEVTHGICPDCYREMMLELGEERP